MDTHGKAAANCTAMAAPDAVAATVFLPAHNEAAALPTLLSALLVVLDLALVERYEIIVVDGEKKLHAWRDGWRILRRSLALALHDHPHRQFVPPDCSDDLPQRATHTAGAICLLSIEDPRHQGA
jgi:hypothetical protein